jgi:hypothetical protein
MKGLISTLAAAVAAGLWGRWVGDGTPGLVGIVAGLGVGLWVYTRLLTWELQSQHPKAEPRER